MARFHVRATPPTSPLLFEYGRDFPAFIEAYEYAQAMPWLADVARIERAWLDAYHAADAAPISAETLAAIPPTRLAGAVEDFDLLFDKVGEFGSTRLNRRYFFSGDEKVSIDARGVIQGDCRMPLTPSGMVPTQIRSDRQ